jgi:glycosyltransferase involved in cell wall biosynthesis
MNIERYPRLAVFVDRIDETTAQLKAFTRCHDLPLLILHRPRHSKVKGALAGFRPDVIHAVLPGNMGLIGTYYARSLQIPLVISWNENAPPRGRIDKLLLNGLYWFPGLAQVLLTPNKDTAHVLRENTGLPTHVIPHAVDTSLFAPSKRVYADGVMRIGYAGELSSGSNVRALTVLERSLHGSHTRPFRFLIVGEGGDRSWLENNLNHGEFTGELEGESLARAIARMDVFAHSPENDVSGTAVLRAMACGVPTVAMSKGAARFLLEDGITGFISSGEADFNRSVLALLRSPELRRKMGREARSRSVQWSWENACEVLYRACRLAVRSFPGTRSRLPMMPPNSIGLRPARY